MSYFPYDRDILTSSLWAQGTPEAFKVWSYLLLSADPRRGIVEDADPAIALRCGLSLEATTEALDWLAGPDPHSRTKDYAGRRIERLPEGGIRVLNYLARQAKDYSTPRVRTWRDRRAEAKRNETLKRVSTVTETTDTDTDTDTTDTPPTPSAGGGTAGGGAPDNGFPREDRQSRPSRRTPKRGPAPPEAQAGAERFVHAFNACFGRRVGVLPDLVLDFAARVGDGYGVDQLVALPILAAAQGLPDDLRKALLPGWLLRDGAHPRTGPDGRVSGAKNWPADLLGRADQTRLWPQHVEAAAAAGVLDVLLGLGATVAEEDLEVVP